MKNKIVQLRTKLLNDKKYFIFHQNHINEQTLLQPAQTPNEK